jgi:hypothetical protein
VFCCDLVDDFGGEEQMSAAGALDLGRFFFGFGLCRFLKDL